MSNLGKDSLSCISFNKSFVVCERSIFIMRGSRRGDKGSGPPPPRYSQVTIGSLINTNTPQTSLGSNCFSREVSTTLCNIRYQKIPRCQQQQTMPKQNRPFLNPFPAIDDNCRLWHFCLCTLEAYMQTIWTKTRLFP